MDYNTLISKVKSDLDNYSFDNSEYDKLFEAAYKSLEDNYRQGEAALQKSYYEDKRQAAASNALDTKSLSEELAARGLATSGESAALRINQALSLNDSLSELAQGNQQARATLLKGYNENKAELNESQAKLMSDTASEERARLYDRLEHLEKLDADKTQAELEKEKWQAELDADMKKWLESLDFEKYKTDAEITADKEKWASELAMEKYLTEAKLAAEETEWRTQLEQQNSQWRTELFFNAFREGNKKETDSANDSDGDGGTASPGISAQTMANNIANRYTNASGGLGSYSQDLVYSELARLIATGDLDEDYASQVLTVLKSRGFKREFSIELASEDYVKEGFTIYNTVFEEYYQGMIDDDATGDDAYAAANEAAVEAVEAHITSQGLDEETEEKVMKMFNFGVH